MYHLALPALVGAILMAPITQVNAQGCRWHDPPNVAPNQLASASCNQMVDRNEIPSDRRGAWISACTAHVNSKLDQCAKPATKECIQDKYVGLRSSICEVNRLNGSTLK